MKLYAHYGHRDFILCLGYKAEMIREYFRNYLWNTCDATLKLGRVDRTFVFIIATKRKTGASRLPIPATTP